MPDDTTKPEEVPRISLVQFHRLFLDMVNLVRFGNRPLIITVARRDACALVPLRDLKRLESLTLLQRARERGRSEDAIRVSIDELFGKDPEPSKGR